MLRSHNSRVSGSRPTRLPQWQEQAHVRRRPARNQVAAISVDSLKRRLGAPALRVVDVRPTALGGVVRGAVKLDCEGNGLKACRATDLHVAEFAFAMARHGVDDGDFVVIYDHAGEGAAAELAEALEYFGHSDVAVLEGGFNRWLAEYGPTDPTPVVPPPASFTARRRYC